MIEFKISITSFFHPDYMRPLNFIQPFLLSFLLISCNPKFQSQKAEFIDYRIHSTRSADSTVLFLLKPYSDNINSTMNRVIGYNEFKLENKQPEGSLGNFMADAFLTIAAEKFNEPVDGAMVNSGGVRLNELPKGNITLSKMYELMPFDNLLLLQKIKGDDLQKFFDYIASKGGWPIAGITLQIKDKKAVNVKVGGQPIDFNKTYTIANSDFVINGGDSDNILKPIPAKNIGYFMRDALIEYVEKMKAAGKNISFKEENRVSYAQ